MQNKKSVSESWQQLTKFSAIWLKVGDFDVIWWENRLSRLPMQKTHALREMKEYGQIWLYLAKNLALTI